MNAIDLKKTTLRITLIAIRKAIPRPLYAAEKAAQNTAQFITDSNIIALYMPFGAEISTLPLAQKLRTLNKTIALPVVETKNAPLIFKEWLPDTKLVKGICNTLEPPLNAEIVNPDIVITPLVGFDKNGYRLGMGGGYYDRTIARLRGQPNPPKFIGFGFDCQEVKKIPVGIFDQQLDNIITNKSIFSCF